MNTKVPKVNINAKSTEELLSQLKKSLEGIEEFKDLRIDFKRELFERPVTDSVLGEGLTLGWENAKIIPADVELKLVNVPLLNVIRYVSDSMKMTFSVKKGEIFFRPLKG